MQTYIYKLTRMDDKEYIGITINIKNRFKSHLKSKRFSSGIKRFSILNVCNSYREAEALEEYYISMYDTFYFGLNESINGKGNHLSENFSTLGRKHSEQSKMLMKKNHWSKRGHESGMKGKKHTKKARKKMSEIRKGICWRKNVVKIEDLEKIHSDFEDKKITFSNDYISNFVKKSQKERVLNNDFNSLSELKSPNGKVLNYSTLFCHYYAKILNVTYVCIREILKDGRGKIC